MRADFLTQTVAPQKNYCLSINFIKKLLTNDNFSRYNAITKSPEVLMETKNKIIKTAKACYIISKTLYILSCVACLAFIVLAITLSRANVVKTFTAEETAVIFSTLALYAFMCVGLLWNVEKIFESIINEKAPFNENASRYLKKIAIFMILLAVVPAIAGSTLIRIICPSTETVFPINFSGIVAGVVTFLLGLFFKYGKELQKNEDETL